MLTHGNVVADFSGFLKVTDVRGASFSCRSCSMAATSSVTSNLSSFISCRRNFTWPHLLLSLLLSLTCVPYSIFGFFSLCISCFLTSCSALQKVIFPNKDDCLISFLPLAHMFERLIEVTALNRPLLGHYWVTRESPCVYVCVGVVDLSLASWFGTLDTHIIIWLPSSGLSWKGHISSHSVVTAGTETKPCDVTHRPAYLPTHTHSRSTKTPYFPHVVLLGQFDHTPCQGPPRGVLAGLERCVSYWAVKRAVPPTLSSGDFTDRKRYQCGLFGTCSDRRPTFYIVWWCAV